MRLAVVLLPIVFAACSSRPQSLTTPERPGPVATTPTAITGEADFPGYANSELLTKGRLSDLTSQPDGDRTRWALGVEDSAGTHSTFDVVLPQAIVPGIASGTAVIVSTRNEGGPNGHGQLIVTDDQGDLLLAIGMLPAGWTADQGPIIHLPGNATVELVDSPWRTFERAGAKYVGHGTGTDFAIIRVP